MDDFVLLPSSKHQKLSGEQIFGEGIDIISSLSDNVLHHIISFLSTKDSIRTSILSIRWKYLWTSISDINLDDISYWSGRRNDTVILTKKNGQCPMGQRFLDSVDTVLLLHDASDTKRLHLNILGPLFMDRVLKAPSFIYFSSPKTLMFDALIFSDDESSQNLFSSCPVLQELYLTNCGWKNVKTLTISIPTLKRLTIEDDPLRADPQM
ncbi:hypothetical protein Vadar_017233 [Vaccinium darrowii]|uniref:Uncharacterized protein n=1 Tax=Vaccinium darrowii TaxID=229202 RepID=A0ACB7YY32_9ERIC|nr:hypothetical protein Vadar_017233 [Vaccinium darrowii]